MGGLGVKVQHFPLTLLVVLTTLTLPCERDDKQFAEGLLLPCKVRPLQVDAAARCLAPPETINVKMSFIEPNIVTTKQPISETGRRCAVWEALEEMV